MNNTYNINASVYENKMYNNLKCTYMLLTKRMERAEGKVRTSEKRTRHLSFPGSGRKSSGSKLFIVMAKSRVLVYQN